MASVSPQNSYWQDAVGFLRSNLRTGERLVTPAVFRKEFKAARTYRATFTESVGSFQWFLVHKGRISDISYSFLKSAVQDWKAVFANEVFVIFSSRNDLRSTPFDSPHLLALIQQLKFQDQLTYRVRHKLQSWQSQTAQQSGLQAELTLLHGDIQKNFDDVSQRLSLLEEANSLLQRSLQAVQQELLSSRSQPAPQASIGLGQLRYQSIQSMSRRELEETSRAACQTSYVGNETLLCRVLGRHLLYGEASDIGIVPHLSLNGFWEPWITLAFARTLQPGWHCLDVGANHGYYSLLMAENVGASGRVLALEPNPRLAALVARTLEVNGFSDRAAVVQKAVSNQSGAKIDLVIPRERGMNATICRPSTASDEVIEVETATLDELTQAWSRIDFIKIDAEGAEELIWHGMAETLRKHSDVIVILEFNTLRYATPQTFLESIVAEGFMLQHIDVDSEVKPLTIEQCLNEHPGEDWMLFLQRPPSA